MTASPMQSPQVHAMSGRQTSRAALLLLDLRDIEEVGTIEEAWEIVPALKAVVLVDPGDGELRAAARAAGATGASSRAEVAVAARPALESSSELAHAMHAAP